jgi:hypothetical protein
MTGSETFCEFDYLESKLPSTRTVLNTIAIIALAVLLEVIVNVRFDAFSPTEDVHGSKSIEAAAPSVSASAPAVAPVQEVHVQQP